MHPPALKRDPDVPLVTFPLHKILVDFLSSYNHIGSQRYDLQSSPTSIFDDCISHTFLRTQIYLLKFFDSEKIHIDIIRYNYNVLQLKINITSIINLSKERKLIQRINLNSIIFNLKIFKPFKK